MTDTKEDTKNIFYKNKSLMVNPTLGSQGKSRKKREDFITIKLKNIKSEKQ